MNAGPDCWVDTVCLMIRAPHSASSWLAMPSLLGQNCGKSFTTKAMSANMGAQA